MAKYVPQRYEDILQRMINKVVARTDLTDLNETSSFKTVLAACARGLDEVYFEVSNLLKAFSLSTAAGSDLDRRAAEFPPDGLTRILAVKATGPLVFSRVVAGGLVNIPVGTRVEVPGENPAIVAVTTAAGTIGVGNVDSAPISATMEKTGVRGNVAASTLTKFKGAKPAGVDSVTNQSVFAGGLDQESDDDFRTRIRAYTRTLSRCTIEALEYIALTAVTGTGQRVVYSKCVEDPISFGKVTLYVDDGAGTAESSTALAAVENLTSGVEFPGDVAQGGEQYLYLDNFPVKSPGASFNLELNGNPLTLGVDYTLNAASGQVYMITPLTAGDVVESPVGGYTWFTGLIKEVQRHVDGDAADRINYPGWRAAGVLVIVRSPTIQSISVAGTITVLDGFTVADVVADVATAIAQYINGLGIGGEVVLAKIIEVSMSVPGVFDCAFTAPTANVAILPDQLPRTNVTTDIALNT